MPKNSFKYLFCFISIIILTIISLKFSFHYFTTIIVSFLIALILHPIVNKIEKIFHLERKLSTAIVSIIILTLFILLCIGTFNIIINEVTDMINDFPTWIEKIKDIISSINTYIDNISTKLPFKIEMSNFSDKLINLLQTAITSGTVAVVDIGKQIPDMLIKVIFGCLFTFFFLVNMEENKNFIKEKFLKNINTTEIITKFKEIVVGYFKAQFKIFLIMFLLLLISFFIIKVPHFFVMAIITAFLDMLPILGTGTILIPYILIELFSKNYGLCIGLLVVYLLAQIIRRIIEPKILGESIGLSTFLSIFWLFVGYQFLGAFGLIIGIPIGVVIKYLLEVGTFNKLIFHLSEIKKWLFETLKK